MGVSDDGQQYAYSLLEVKSIDDEQRVIVGIASTPEPDRVGDSMLPTGAQFKLPMPLLWQHSQANPIGEVFAATVTSKGIEIRARIAHITEPGRLKERIDEAWQAIKFKLVRGLSIGWKPIDAEPIRSKGTVVMHHTKWHWFETSAVTVPANVSTSILAIKSIDAASRAVSGTRAHVPSPSGVPGSAHTRRTMQVSEQINTVKEDIQTKTARLTELIEKDEAELSDDEVKEQSGLTASLKSLRGRMESLTTLESAMSDQAHPVTYAPTQKREPRVSVTDHAKELPKGTLFTRYAMAVAAGKGSLSDTIAYAKRWDSQTPEVSRYIKAIEGTAVVGSPAWGGELVFQNNLASEFVELVRARTLVGRIDNFRRVPFNVRIPVQSGGSTVNWVGEAAPKPVTELAFTTLTVPYHKIAGIIVLTEELVRFSSPDAEATVRRDLTDQIAQFIDEQFIRVAVTAGANNPASITNGVASPAASGTTLAALYADLKTALATFDTAGITTEDLAIVTTPAVARILSLMVTSLGMAPSGFSVSANGGTLLGYPVYVSASVDAGTLVIFKPSEIFLADDGRVSLDASNQATLDMSGGSSPDFNLWQKDCIGIRAERFITWVKRRAGVVAVIDTIAYVPGT